MADPSILLHPNIPKPLHGIAPRVIKGQEWWDTERRLCYARAGFRCEACGVPKEQAMFHRWLEAHEVYRYDYKKGRLYFERLVALCNACHNFIHSGRLRIMLAQGQISQDRFDTIMAHGNHMIHDLPVKKLPTKCAAWKNWRMVVDGREYGPSTRSYEEWFDGGWRNWKP